MANTLCVISLLLTLTLPFASFATEDGQLPKYDQKTASYKDIQVLAHALSIVQFASKSDVNKKIFLYSALDGMARALDRYSYFVPPEMVAIFMRQMKEKRVGIGVHVARTDDGNIEVISTEPDSPAFKAGIKPKDVITAIDGQQVKNLKFIDAFKLIAGINYSSGSNVRLSVLRKDVANPIEFVVTREFLQLKTIEWKLLDKDYGYVRLTGFYNNTAADFKNAIEEMRRKDHGIKGLVIDLRNNPGGDVHASIELSKMFLDSGMIVSFESNFPGYSVKVRADKGSTFSGPVAILVDGGSASASELFAGALQVSKRAKLVGKKTYGKGTAQSFMPISEDGGLYLTIGRFLLPDGSSVEGKGLVPDLLINQDIKEEELLKKAIQLIINNG